MCTSDKAGLRLCTLIMSSALSIPFCTSLIYLQSHTHNSLDTHNQTVPTHEGGAFLETAAPMEGSSSRQVFRE